MGNDIASELARRHTGADFLAFLKRVARRYRGQELHIILDSSSTHTTSEVQAWLTAHPRHSTSFNRLHPAKAGSPERPERRGR